MQNVLFWPNRIPGPAHLVKKCANCQSTFVNVDGEDCLQFVISKMFEALQITFFFYLISRINYF
jgi:hypothetical protein